MKLLPSEQREKTKKAIVEYKNNGILTIEEPCDCGSHIRHNNGGNYHTIIFLKKDGNQSFVKIETTCELTPPAEWNFCSSPIKIICKYADWL